MAGRLSQKLETLPRRFDVFRSKIRWHRVAGPEPALAMLPEDAHRRGAPLERRVIVETKYYAEPFTGRYGAKKLRSGHLYQILAYQQNRSAARKTGPPYEGMLLYPVVKEAFTYDYTLDGHRVAVRSIDLDQP